MKHLLEKPRNTWMIDGMPWWRGLIVYALVMTLTVVYLIVHFVNKWIMRAWRKANMLTLKYWHLFYPMAWWN